MVKDLGGQQGDPGIYGDCKGMLVVPVQEYAMSIRLFLLLQTVLRGNGATFFPRRIVHGSVRTTSRGSGARNPTRAA